MVPQHLPVEIGECLPEGHCKGRNETVLMILWSVIKIDWTVYRHYDFNLDSIYEKAP